MSAKVINLDTARRARATASEKPAFDLREMLAYDLREMRAFSHKQLTEWAQLPKGDAWGDYARRTLRRENP